MASFFLPLGPSSCLSWSTKTTKNCCTNSTASRNTLRLCAWTAQPYTIKPPRDCIVDQPGRFLGLGCRNFSGARLWGLFRARVLRCRCHQPSLRAQHAVHRRESSGTSGAVAGAWATREDLLETKKVSVPHDRDFGLVGIGNVVHELGLLAVPDGKMS